MTENTAKTASTASTANTAQAANTGAAAKESLTFFNLPWQVFERPPAGGRF